MKLLVAVFVLGCSTTLDAQTARPRAASPAVTTALSITVTDGKGAPLGGVAVRVSGPVDREGQTESSGTLRLQGLRGGTYRIRFTRDGFVTLERDVAVPAGQRSLEQHVMLSASERAAAPSPPAPESPKPAALPPPGRAVTVSVPDYIERNFIAASQPQKISPVACSGLVQSVLWQIREPWDKRQHTGADAMLYVIGGGGSLRLEGRDVPLQAGTFVSVPRGTTYGFTRRGRNPLIVLANLAGEPCAP